MTDLVSLSPAFTESQFFDNLGRPLVGGLIYTYAAGSSTSEQVTYTTNAANVANTNPIVLDSSGRPTTEIWLIDGTGYNMVLTDTNNTVLRSCDNIIGIQATNIPGAIGTVIWNVVNQLFNYVSATQFYLVGDFTAEFQIGNRVQYQFTDNSYGYGVVTSNAVSGPNTYVTILPDSVNLSNTVTAMAWSVIAAPNYTADAGAIGYTSSISYGGSTVGAQIQSLYTLIANWNRSYETTGTAPDYVLTSNVPLQAYDNLVLNVKFHASSTNTASTINVNNIGAIPLVQYDSSGTTINPHIVANQMALLMYDGTQMIITNALPSIPTGTIMFFAADSVPAGWLNCNGASYSSTNYPTLFGVIGYTYGGDGTFFNVPDMQGKFARGYDQGGSIDPSRTFGSTQTSAMAEHMHGFGYQSGDNNGYFLNGPHTYKTDGISNGINWNGSGGGIGFTGIGNPSSIMLGTTNQLELSGETRPINIAFLACIKV